MRWLRWGGATISRESIRISSLSPKAVWGHFNALCAIPRPSGHEGDAVRYVEDFARGLGLECLVDETGNIIVRKEASAGMEGCTGIVLQSHLDIVPQKNEGTAHDFLKDPINTYIENGWVKARGTTLGADNGIGAAMALAVLEDTELKHGPIEALFTVDEEAGMTGAKGLEPGVLKGKAFINLDTEDEGEIYIGCAGGVDVTAAIPIELVGYGDVGSDNHDNYDKYNHHIQLSITGLKGGHSGLDIHLGRGNAIKILARVLDEVSREFDIKISSIKGGSVRNAIPREAFCGIVISQNDYDDLVNRVNKIDAMIKDELRDVDPDINIRIEKSIEKIFRVMTDGSKNRLIHALRDCPNGVFGMIDNVPNVVETSSNLAIVNIINNTAVIQCLTRSSVDVRRDGVIAEIRSNLEPISAEVRVSGEYPGWKPNPNSRLLAMMKKAYRDAFGVDAKVKVVHAGLECGIIAAKYPRMEFVSIGPTIKHPHSPGECLCVESVERCWRFLTTALGAVRYY